MTTIPTPHQTPTQASLVRPPAPAPVPMPAPVPAPEAFAPPALPQPLADGAQQPGTATAYAVAHGGTATAYAIATTPPAAPATAPPAGPTPDAPATRRTWRTAAATAVLGLFLTAAGCGVLSLAYPPLERVAQVAGAVSTTAAAATTIAATTINRRGNGSNQR
ncbi:hypothetical protein [Streptomyces sp. NPDC050355]|uniref:hypothetical protein n=1 Tax=Streptomyces sp. NPDC050355 TaxID=3365609 RepID=UPI0037954557